MKTSLFVAALLSVATSVAAQAGECVVNINRTACAGKESESYSKCGGSKSCDKDEGASSEAECVAAAKSNCPNSRLDITKSKVVKARYNGKSLAGPFGGNFCAPNRPDFNKCK